MRPNWLRLDRGRTLRAPLFVVGLNKSGTSLLYLVLCRHPQLSGIRAQSQSTGKARRTRIYLPDYNLSEGHKISALPAKLKTHEKSYQFAHPRYVAQYRLTEADVEPGDRRQVSSAYRGAMTDARKRLVEKSPPNLVRTRYLQALFPDASFVAIVRHPFANVSENAKKYEKWGPAADQARHWANAHRLFLEDRQSLRRCLTIRYVDFVADPVGVLAAIEEHCGLTPADLSQDIDISTDINAELVTLLSADEKEMIARTCAVEMRELGYGDTDLADIVG